MFDYTFKSRDGDTRTIRSTRLLFAENLLKRDHPDFTPYAVTGCNRVTE